MIRKWTSELLNEHLDFVTGPINNFFDFAFHPIVQDFEEYAAQNSVEPGMVDWLLAALPVVGYLAFVTMGVWSTLETFRPVVDASSSILRGGKKTTKRGRIYLSIFIVAGFEALNYIIDGNVYVWQMWANLSKKIAVFLSMTQDPGFQSDITSFTWGLLDNPQWEFLVVVAAITLIAAGAISYVYNYSPLWTILGLATPIIGTFVYVSIAGVDVFPTNGLLGMLLRIVALWIVVMTPIAWGLSTVPYVLIQWLPWVDYSPDSPNALYMTFDGLVFMLAFPIFPSEATMALLGWFSYKFFRHGGGEKALNIATGRYCHEDPETGQTMCGIGGE